MTRKNRAIVLRLLSCVGKIKICICSSLVKIARSEGVGSVLSESFV